ncbi:unnamed protein product [Spirodela intermedia]|uniref:BZIP domain-containing protein n=1 Tax=Spirodela intermedia TaxID=51605 RepID=A0A7I8IN77_SPIIN|nr:unnamed protein product [Spirodela intermedia]CAA6659427.1 unnamed protein product [Spirodela intermedia]
MDFRGIGRAAGAPPEGSSGGGGGGVPAALARQPSIYALTFEEFQNTLGASRDFGSMNMDELLKSIWTAEETQTMSSFADGGGGTAGVVAGLQRQGSLTLPRTLSQKTVDEVWRDVFKDGGAAAVPGVGAGLQPPVQRQPTLGEVTLEEFLIRVGLTREAVEPERTAINGGLLFGNASSSLVNSSPRLFLGFSPAAQQSNGPGPAAAAAGNMMINGGGAALRPQMQVAAGRVTVASASPARDEGRKPGGGLERVVERRQRRMIKNRESAARSRARKQAYTMELEAEITKLKEQNEELQKKQEEILVMQKNQVLEKVNQQYGSKKQCLRRTQTGPW